MAPRKLRPVATLLGHSSWSLRCAISANGRYALSGDGVPSARIWDLEEPSNSKEFASDLPLGIRQCALSDDGSLASVAADGRGVSINEISTGKRLFIIEEPTELRLQYSAGGCALSGDGSILVAAFRTSNRAHGQLHVVRWKNPAAKPIILKRNYSIWQCEISSDARKVVFKYWKGSKSGVELIDTHTGETLGKWEVSNGEWNFAIDASARTLVTADSRSLKVIDMKTSETRNMKSYTFSAFAGVDISANGKHIVAPLADYKFGIWEADTGRLIAVLGGHQNRSNGCAISADGTRVLTCSNDRTVRVWDTRGATSGIGADAVREALRSILNGENLNTTDHTLVRESVRECELGNAEELLQAHAALVIALRSAAAKHDLNERNLVQKSAETVYATIEGKLHDKPDVQLGQVVMAHAEQRGLLSSGLPVQHMGTYYNLSEKSVNRLRENINGAWKEVIPLKDSDNIDNVIMKHLNRLYTSMKVGKEGIENGLFPNIASCVLLLWSGSKSRSLKSEYGKSESRSIKSMLAMESPKDVAWIETVMPFDISSPRVLRYLMKRSTIEKLPVRRKHLIQKAVSNSRFQSVEKVESELTALIEKLARVRGKFQSVLEIDIDDIAEVADSDDDSTSKRQGYSSVRSTIVKSPLVQSRSQKYENQLEIQQETFVKDNEKMKELLEVLQQTSNPIEQSKLENDTKQAETNIPVESSVPKTADKNDSSTDVMQRKEIPNTEEKIESSIKNPLPLAASKSVENIMKESGDKSNILEPISITSDLSNQIDSQKVVQPEEKFDTIERSSVTLNSASEALNQKTIEPESKFNTTEQKSVTPDLSSEVLNRKVIRTEREHIQTEKKSLAAETPVVMQAVTHTRSEEIPIAPERETPRGPQTVQEVKQLSQLDRSSTIKTYVPEKEASAATKEDIVVRNVIERLSTSDDNKQIISEQLDEIRLNIDCNDDDKQKIADVSNKNREARPKKPKTNALLGIAAITAFFICAALLTLVILKMR